MINPNYQANQFPTLTTADRDYVKALVASQVAALALFTAFDITKMVRQSGAIPGVAHWQVKGIVHDMFGNDEMGTDYTRTLHNVGAKDPAFVYHPYTISVSNYGTVTVPNTVPTPVPNPVSRPTVTGRTTFSKQPVGASPFGAIAGQVNTLKDGTAKSDKLGRILVPKKALAHIGATPKSQVYMTKQADGSIVITNDSSSGTAYTVDIYTNLKFKIGTDLEFMIDGDNQRIVLTPVLP